MAGEAVWHNGFRRALRARQRQIGFWASSCSNLVAEVLGLTGFDWLLLDGEHAPNELPDLIGQLQALQGSPTHAVVRPAWNDPVLIKRLLDSGVFNFLIPFVESVEEARAAVAATRYPPRGIRGVSMIQRMNRYGTLPDYFERIDDEIAVTVQIETPAGAAAAEAILDVDGVDGIFVGPSDLAATHGHLGNPGHPDVQALIERLGRTAAEAGKAAGILALAEEDIRRYLGWGYTFVAVGTDLMLLRQGATALAAKYR